MGLQLESQSKQFSTAKPSFKKKSQVEFTVAYSTTAAATGKYAHQSDKDG